MYEKLFWSLILIPWIGALGAYTIFRRSHIPNVIITTLTFIILTAVSVFMWFNYHQPIKIYTPHWLDWVITLYDYLLLFYFLKQGIEHKHKLVSVLAIIQLILLTWALVLFPDKELYNVYIDRLSIFMFIIVGFVGSLITVFATQYMKHEAPEREGEFVAILVWFLGVMNFAVAVNNIEWFFALFETTTLASYLLIRFREDLISINNALLALWMNQIGGIAILLALLFSIHKYHITHFNELLEEKTILLFPLAFLSASALVKGAQMPFHRWLLGAMVAPTPVSAILHSATMVKIAPYLILRLSPVIKGTLLAKLIILYTGFVFVITALLALNEVNFKRILAYSTVSLLALMMLAGAVGTPLAITVSLMLIAFHALAKALLFLEAGVMEKLYKAKTIYDMKHIINKAPATVFFILIGFLSMTMVPFAMFVAKWLLISEMAQLLSKASYIITVGILALGGAILTILYIKILGIAINRDEEEFKVKLERLPVLYALPNTLYVGIILTATLFIAKVIAHFFAPIVSDLGEGTLSGLVKDSFSVIIGDLELSFWQIAIALFFVVVFPIIAHFLHFKADTSPEYACGEHIKLQISTYNMECLEKAKSYFEMIALSLFVLVLIVGGGML
jgi:ech hydrogenase subunit A